jgi:hypothetical protein
MVVPMAPSMIMIFSDMRLSMYSRTILPSTGTARALKDARDTRPSASDARTVGDGAQLCAPMQTAGDQIDVAMQLRGDAPRGARARTAPRQVWERVGVGGLLCDRDRRGARERKLRLVKLLLERGDGGAELVRGHGSKRRLGQPRDLGLHGNGDGLSINV